MRRQLSTPELCSVLSSTVVLGTYAPLPCTTLLARGYVHCWKRKKKKKKKGNESVQVQVQVRTSVKSTVKGLELEEQVGRVKMTGTIH